MDPIKQERRRLFKCFTSGPDSFSARAGGVFLNIGCAAQRLDRSFLEGGADEFV